ncbi:hypothetical protein JG688_00012689, partial [Phytophthora aleatoria]
LQVNGYLRGKPLSVKQLIHITDVGTFQMSCITVCQVQHGKMDADMSAKPPVAPTAAGQDEVLVLAMADPALQEGLRFEAEYDPFASEQTWPTNEEIAEAEAEAKKQRQVETAANKEENMTFTDEVDAPVDRPARVRSARYRGMKSLRTSAWDLKQSLPLDYARLFQVEDFAMVQRLALARGKDAERAMKGQLRRKSQDPADSFSCFVDGNGGRGGLGFRCIILSW